MRVRCRIEIGQLVEFYGAEKPGARDPFQMLGSLARKILEMDPESETEGVAG
jgi:hypothetical protein